VFDKIRIPIYLQITYSIKHSNSYSMKKIFAAVAIVALFASCKKDYTCTCSVGGVVASTVSYDGLSKGDADDAEAACTAGSITVNGVTTGCAWAEK
jgi:hypothetical protein